jgi:APA family basic amino acid/polyamine antiporter
LSQQKIYLRNATGLVRDFAIIDTLFLTVGAIIGPTWLPVFTGEWYLFPGVSVPGSFALIGILAVLNGLYYVLITAVMPRSGGGGYVPLSRVYHPTLGLGMTFILATAFILNLGFIANITVTVGIAGPLSTYGTLIKNSSILSLASTLSTPIWGFALGSLMILVIGLIALSGTRTIQMINRFAFALGTLGFLIIIAILLTTSQSKFEGILNSFAGAGTYQNIITTAHENGWSVPSNWIRPTLLSLPLSFFSMLGYAFSTYYSGELRRATRTMSIAMIGSIVYAGAMFSIVATLMLNSFGSDFVQSAGYLYNALPSKYPLNVPPWPNTFVGMITSNPIINILLIASYVAWGYFLIINFYFIVSRHFLAWSFDRAIPSFFGRVSERFHAPTTAIVVIGVISWISLAFYSFLPTILGPVNIAFLFIAALVLDGLAGVALPWRRKRIYEQAPLVAKKKIFGIPVVSILGIYSFVFLLFLLVESLYNSSIIGAIGTISIFTVVAAFVIGILSYFGMKYYLKGKGFDLNLAFQEIPPE